MMNDPYTLIVALDQNEKAKGRLYIDDGQSYKVCNDMTSERISLGSKPLPIQPVYTMYIETLLLKISVSRGGKSVHRINL